MLRPLRGIPVLGVSFAPVSAGLFALCLLFGGTAPELRAQTAAHFSWTQTAVGSGFSIPHGVAVDKSGNVYVADSNNNQVKEILAVNGIIPASPTIRTLGSGSFVTPEGVAVDAKGDVFVADGTGVVEEIEADNGVIPPSPTIRVLGGYVFGEPVALAVDASGNVYVADAFPLSGSGAVDEIEAPAYGAVATLSNAFNDPVGVAVDASGNVYVGDTLNNAVKEIVAVGGAIPASPTILSLDSGFSEPEGVAVDASGNVYVANTNNLVTNGGEVEEIVAVNGVIPASPTVLTLGSGFSAPFDVVVNASGNIYVADGSLSYIAELQTHGVNFRTLSVGGVSSTLPLVFTFDTGGTIGTPQVLTQGAANLDFTDAGTGSCTTNGTGYSYNSGDTCTVQVTFKPKYAGTRTGAVLLLNANGTVIATGYVQGIGTGPQIAYGPGVQTAVGGGLSFPTSMAVDGSGNVYIADSGNGRVLKAPPTDLACSIPGDCTTVGSLYQPMGVAVDGSGNVYIADQTLGRVVKVPWTGSGYGTQITVAVGTSSSGNPTGVAVDGTGNVYIAYDGLGQVVKVSWTGSGYGAQTAVGGALSSLSGVAVDGIGNVYIAEAGSNTVLKVPPTDLTCSTPGDCTTVGSWTSNPTGVAVDGNGNVYVTVGLQVVEVPWTGSGYGAQTTVGNGFAEPFGVAVDAGGNLYVADYANGAVKIDLADAPTLTFAATNVGTTSSDSPQTVTIENIGNETLTFTAPPSYPASFPENGSAADLCASNTSLAEGSSCNVSVNFVPIAGGSNAGGLVLTDNALNGTPAIQSIPLTGVGFAATQLAFVTAPVSNILTGGNAGAAITVEEENSMGTLVSSASDTIILAVTGPGGYFQLYSATASGGIATFNLSAVPLTAAGSYTYAASGSSLTSAVATETVVAPALNFGSSTGVGSSTPAQTVTLYIANSGTLNQIQVLTEGAPNLDFTQASGGTCATGTIYTAGQTCTVNVMFTPLYAGTRLGAVLLTDSNGNALGTAYLSGTGTGAQIAFGPGVRSTMGIGANYPQASPQGPRSVAVDGSGNVYIADSNNGRVLKAPLADLACSTPGDCTTVGTGLQGPSGVAVDGSGNVYIADPGIGQVVQVPWTGSGYGAQTVVGSFVQPSGVAVDGNGNVYVAASGSSQVFEIAWTGSGYGVQTALASGGGLSTPLNGPTGVAVDGSGNVYIADPNNARVIQVPPTDLACSTAGDCLTVGSGLIGPNGVAVDGNGNVYIADLSLAQVVKVPWTGSGYGAQTAASGFGGPYGVAVDGSGNIYVADLINSDTLKVDLADAPSLTFASTNVSSTSSDSPQIVTLENIGNQPLDFSGQTISTNWQQVATGGTDCSASSQIAQGTTCNLAISFMPQTAGSPLTGGVALTDNTLNQANPTQTIALSGIALQQSQTISFTLLGPVTYGIGPITLAATASSGLTPTFSVVSGPGSISGNTLSITGAGTIVVAANQTGNATYLAAPQVTQTLMVNMAAPTVNWTPVPTISYGTALSFLSNVTATYNSQTIPGVFTYTAQSAAGGAAPVTASTTLAAGTYTLTASFAPADAVDYAPATASAQIVVTDDALALTVNNAARVYGTPNPTFTGNVAGAANGDSFTESFTTTATIGSNVGSYPIVPTVTGTNLPNYAVTAQNGTLTITQAASAVTLVSSALTSSPNTSVTFTATVASATTGTPTGSVQFFDGATQLGAGTLNTQGVASLTVATLATGAHTISADYSGDINFTQSVSPALTQTVTVPPDYSLAANPTALTIEPGQTGTITFTVTPVGGYTGTVNFSCAGLPAGASCSFSPASVSLDGSDTLQTTQLSIVTLGPNHGTVSMNRRGDISRSDPVRASLFLLPGILLGGFLTWRRNKLAGTLKGTLVVLILISAIGGLAGCGGSSSPSVKPGTSTVTVTATANAAGNGSSESQTATFTLTIAQ